MKLKEMLQRIRSACTRDKIKDTARRWGRFLLNPRLLLCVFLAWMITNGWSYILFGAGMLLKINWMRMVGGAYMSLLWLPFTPEKLITIVLAIALLRLLFPRDQKTLGVLKRLSKKLRREGA